MRDPRMCVLQVKRRDHENGRAFAYLPVLRATPEIVRHLFLP